MILCFLLTVNYDLVCVIHVVITHSKNYCYDAAAGPATTLYLT